ncbi:MAG TPA: MFS transporter [Actinomycetes bacterium]|nr:MFS transporter [Actinomycetes bacterium]
MSLLSERRLRGWAGAPLPAPVRRMLAAVLVGALGNGLVLPFLVVYLSQVRGIPASIAGLAVAWEALLSFALTPTAGWLVDRFGPGPVLRLSPLVCAVATAGWAFVHTAPQAFLPATVSAVGNVGLWPAGATLLSRLVGEDERQRVFGLNFAALNLGIGVGGLLAGLFVDARRPVTFQLLYLGDALAFLAFAAIMFSMRGVGGPIPPATPTEEESPGTWRDIAADRALRRLAVLSVVMLTCGYGALEVGFPYFASTVVGVSDRVVAFGYVGNTVAIVLGQMVVIRVLRGRRRSRALGLVGLLWAGSWLVLGLASKASGAGAVLLVLLCPLVFAVGETLWQPVTPAIINDLAPEDLRGRYNAVGTLTWSLSGMLGPALTGVLLGAGHSAAWVVLVTVGCLAAGALALRLRRVLTPGQDGLAPGDMAIPIGHAAGAGLVAEVPD